MPLIDHLTESHLAATMLATDSASHRTLYAMAQYLEEALKRDHRIFVVGNGGSAADAQHIAAEFIGRFRDMDPNRLPLPAIALTTDTSTLTAIGNDFSFARVFRRQVDALGKPGDVLWCLSTSGESPNIVEAAVGARDLGMHVISFTGKKTSKLGAASHLCWRAPHDDTAVVQQLHMTGYHAIIGEVEETLSYLWRPRS